VIQLLSDGALPRPTTKKVAEALRKEIEPLKVLGVLRRDIPLAFLQPTRAQVAGHEHTELIPDFGSRSREGGVSGGSP
jgi:hypothetical protein